MTSQTRRLRNADFTEPRAQAIADTIDDATRHLATGAEPYRAMRVPALGMTPVNAAMLGAAATVIKFA